MNSLRQSFKGLFLSSSDGTAGDSAKSPSSAFPLMRTENLSDTQESALQLLRQHFPGAADGELIGYLKVRGWRSADASMQYQSSLAWEKSISPTIADVAGFMRGAPDGCIICLEDMRGDCARDELGRPIVLSIGMLYGTLYEQQQQMVYALRRARTYYRDDTQIYSNCVVIEVAPRAGARATFRFPDHNTKLLMEMQKQHFPSTLSSTTHFCGVPTPLTWAFALCKPFMDAEAYNNMVLRQDFSHLTSSRYIDKASTLKEWGGEFEFNIESYIQWRALVEGVVLGDDIRRYDPTTSSSTDNTSLEQSLLQVTAAEHRKRALRFGEVDKRGGGVGLFSSYKWKSKRLMLLPGVLLYFDRKQELDEEGNDTPSAAIVLSNGTHTRKLLDLNESGPTAWAFEVVTPGRAYTFACSNEEQMKDWMDAISDACN